MAADRDLHSLRRLKSDPGLCFADADVHYIFLKPYSETTCGVKFGIQHRNGPARQAGAPHSFQIARFALRLTSPAQQHDFVTHFGDLPCGCVLPTIVKFHQRCLIGWDGTATNSTGPGDRLNDVFGGCSTKRGRARCHEDIGSKAVSTHRTPKCVLAMIYGILWMENAARGLNAQRALRSPSSAVVAGWDSNTRLMPISVVFRCLQRQAWPANTQEPSVKEQQHRHSLGSPAGACFPRWGPGP